MRVYKGSDYADLLARLINGNDNTSTTDIVVSDMTVKLDHLFRVFQLCLIKFLICTYLGQLGSAPVHTALLYLGGQYNSCTKSKSTG